MIWRKCRLIAPALFVQTPVIAHGQIRTDARAVFVYHTFPSNNTSIRCQIILFLCAISNGFFHPFCPFFSLSLSSFLFAFTERVCSPKSVYCQNIRVLFDSIFETIMVCLNFISHLASSVFYVDEFLKTCFINHNKQIEMYISLNARRAENLIGIRQIRKISQWSSKPIKSCSQMQIQTHRTSHDQYRAAPVTIRFLNYSEISDPVSIIH